MFKSIIKLFITIIITLTTLILCKSNKEVKQFLYDNVFNSNINFALINNYYKKYFGNNIPFKDNIDIKPVFNEKLEYENKEKVTNGIKLSVGEDYLVPSIESGLVIFIGDKDNFKNVVIVQQIDGVDTWYANMNNINVKLYDYINKGTLIGDCNNDLYILNKKNGKFINYEANI